VLCNITTHTTTSVITKQHINHIVEILPLSHISTGVSPNLHDHNGVAYHPGGNCVHGVVYEQKLKNTTHSSQAMQESSDEEYEDHEEHHQHKEYLHHQPSIR
jgi:hypothetical protein